jgi:hypothetical protein
MNGNEFVQTNFSGADLSSVNSSRDSFVGKSNFESTTLSGAIFDKATFKDANFSNAKFGKSKFPNNQWISIKLKGAKLQEASLRGVKSSRLSGGPALPSNVKLLGGVLQMAPAAPVFVKYAKSGTRHVMTWSEVLQTGVSATMRYRISTDKVRWSAWTEAKGARTEDPFRFRTQVRFTLRKVQPGTEYFVQAYWINAMGKSKTRIARIQVI